MTYRLTEITDSLLSGARRTSKSTYALLCKDGLERVCNIRCHLGWGFRYKETTVLKSLELTF